jgi:hypothetical protein
MGINTIRSEPTLKRGFPEARSSEVSRKACVRQSLSNVPKDGFSRFDSSDKAET